VKILTAFDSIGRRCRGCQD